MLLRSLWVAGAVAGVALLGAGAAAALPQPWQEEPSGWLELDAGPAGQVHRLTPGGTADWAVDIRVPGEAAGTLEVELQPGTGAPPLLQEYLSVQLRACDQPWDGDSCPAGERILLEPTGLDQAAARTVDLMEPGATWSTGTYVLVTAALADDVPQEIQGSRTQIVLGVRGSGDESAGALRSEPELPPSSINSGDNSDSGSSGNSGDNGLADTGARLGGFALLGVVAVAAGFGFARLRGGSA